MYARLVTFRLDATAVDQYEAHAHEVAVAFTDWQGLISKVWLADRQSRTYGGFYVFESRAAADASRDTDVFRGMTADPGFFDLTITEFAVLDGATAVTGGPLVSLAT